MLDLKQILDQYPPMLRQHDNSLLREYLQYQILNIIYQSKLATKLVFLGGTALRIVYNNQRFSEDLDLDFDNLGLSQQELSSLETIIAKKLALKGLNAETNIAGKQGFRLKIRFLDILYQLKLSPHKQEKIIINVDITPQNFNYEPNRLIIQKFDIKTPIIVVPPSLLLSQKIYAISNRPRLLGRDFFDILHLYNQRVEPDWKYLKQKLDIDDLTTLKQYLHDVAKKANFKQLAQSISAFVFRSEDENKLLDFIKLTDVYLLNLTETQK